jgi:predicted dehydrogenase
MKKVNWALIGCGDIAKKRVAPALRELLNTDFVAVTSAQVTTAEAFAKEFGAKRWHHNWQTLLQDDEIEAVYIATPVHLHEPITVAAARAGKHVLCEKPMALNLIECDQMLEACYKNHVKLGIAYYRHFYPVLIRIKELIAADEIGEVVYVQMNAFRYFNPQPGIRDIGSWKKTRLAVGRCLISAATASKCCFIFLERWNRCLVS